MLDQRLYTSTKKAQTIGVCPDPILKNGSAGMSLAFPIKITLWG